MNVKEFEAWPSRNVGKGGKRPKTDPFNKAMKGSERNPSAPEYASMDVPEYHRYAENVDLRKEDDDDQQNENSQSSQQQNQNRNSSSRSPASAARAAQSVARNLIPKVVLVVAGSIVVVQGYRTIKAHEAQANPVVASTTWTWGGDYTSATYGEYDKDGKLIREIPATITSTEVAATCTKGGQITYTATVQDGDKAYTDTKTEALEALGHDFDDGTMTTIDGKESIVYECSRCGEEFVITVSTGEDDPTIPRYLANWTWSEDHLSCDVELVDEDGHLIAQGEATVVTSFVPATCTKDGSTTYKASYDLEWETYTDAYVEPIPAIGHSFDEGTETTIGGKPAIVYVCSECQEEFTIIIDTEETDPTDPIDPDFAGIPHHYQQEAASFIHEDCHHCDHHHHI